MHLHFEQNISSRTECTIHSLSWMGKVPDSIPGDTTGGWKLNRGQYYSEGWLSSGNAKGIVGVTFSASHCRRYEPPNRSNFNLRGHRSEVVLVCWNEPYQKLATCDAQGIIFVWIKHEGRWSIELINDRNSQVTDFAWSHDGRMALICYCDGFVLVGSVAGQRYWSSMLNLDNTSITCGVWSPDDQKVLFGTTDGQILVMSSTGAMVSQITILEGMEISALLWSCEKFNMEETADGEHSEGLKVTKESGASSPTSEKVHTLAVCFKYGAIYFMNNYDDVCPKVVHSLLTGLKIDWSNCGQYLAVGGFTRLPNLQCQNEIHFYSPTGELVHWVSVPSQGKPLTALCWGHNDRRLFVAAGHNLYVAWVVKHVPSLQYLCQRSVQCLVRGEHSLPKLPLPIKLCASVQALFSPTIKSYIPDPFKLQEFVSTPPPGSERLFCTMIRHGEENSGGHYTLYLEYLGGLIPLLKGKRASKLRPDFVIYDPKIKAKSTKKEDGDSLAQYEVEILSESDSSDSDIEADGCGGSPRSNRRKRLRNFRAEKVERSTTFRTLNELLYNDNLPESCKLVEVLSNIWGTKFRILGTAASLPDDLGNVLYKTSLLHLQPRQMTVTVSELPRFTPTVHTKSCKLVEVLSNIWGTKFRILGTAASLPDDLGNVLYKTSLLHLQPRQMTVTVSELPRDDELLLAQDLHFTPAGLGEEDPDRLSPIDGLLSGVHNEHFYRGSSEESNGQNADIISVDVLTNHLELSSHLDSVSENNSINSSTSCYSDRQKTVCMKTKLSPASETHPQNNNAFKIGEDTQILDSYIHQGARPKVPPNNLSHSANQTVVDETGVIGLTSNVVGGTKSFPSSVKSVSSQGEGSSLKDVSSANNASSPVVGDYFFTTPDSSSDKSNENVDSVDGVHNNKTMPSFVDRFIRTDVQDNIPRWADPAIQGIKFADDDDSNGKEIVYESNIVCDSSQIVTPTSDTNKRLYLEGSQDADATEILPHDMKPHDASILKLAAKRTSVDSSGASTNGYLDSAEDLTDSQPDLVSSEVDLVTAKIEKALMMKKRKTSLNEYERLHDITQSASLPASPLHRLHQLDSPTKKIREEIIHGKCKHHSPLFKRKSKYVRSLENSDDDFGSSAEDVRVSYNYKNLESFQKAQLKQKLKRVRSKGEKRKGSRQFVMHNKAPLWNEISQVYQLDFGGRVTQESAKNFQIEYRGKQVMQFGRIDSNAYTLDFQYPFTAIQAFAVALANVTQRLK